MTAHKRTAQILLFLLAVAMITVGTMQDGYREVLEKAVMICRECIGIG